MSIRTIIVDDEPLARRGLELRLQAAPDITIVRQCANGREAIASIAEDQPDLMFLDIQMPGISGLDVVAQVPQESMPMVVFVTAFDRYAIDAFEAHALDYLLKPVDEARLAAALDRVRAQWQQRQALAQREQLMALLADLTGLAWDLIISAILRLLAGAALLRWGNPAGSTESVNPGTVLESRG